MENRPWVIMLMTLQVEYEAIRAQLLDVAAITTSGTSYERGSFVGENQSWQVALVNIGEDRAGAGLKVERAIRYFKPELILFVGVADGLKDVQPGDVVVATKIYSCDFYATESFQPRPEVARSSYFLMQRARVEAMEKQWLHRLPTVPTSRPSAFLAPVIAVEKAPTYNPVSLKQLQKLRQSYRDALAIEVDVIDVLQNTLEYYLKKTLVIRGITALINEQQPSSIKIQKKQAAEHACAFAFALLAKYTSQRETAAQLAPQLSLAPQLKSTKAVPTSTIEIFYAYAFEDEPYAQALQKQLIVLKRSGVISDWHAGRIMAGEDYTQKIEQQFDKVDIILLLISPDFLDTEYAYIEGALERRRAHESVVIPVLLRRTADWNATQFGVLQSLPRNERAVADFPDRDKALAEIAHEIRAVIEKLKGARAL